jgi:hypothetical protein
MTRARLPLIVAGCAALALTLTACEKPNPGATVFSGTSSEYSLAACWADEGGQIDQNQCAQDLLANAASGQATKPIPVVPGEVIGISVDPVVADAGWFPRINGQNLAETPLTSTYFRFTFPEFQQVAADGLTLEVVAGSDAATRGLWLFRLAPAS